MTKDEIEFVNIDLSPVPSHILCPNCNCPANTNTVIKNTKRTHLFAILMTICGCCLCSWIPYTINDCRSIRHYCQRCNSYVGSYGKTDKKLF